MKIKYVGPSEEVSLTQDAGGLTFHRNEPVDVPADLARSLLEQDTFVRVTKPRPQGQGSAARSSDDVETR